MNSLKSLGVIAQTPPPSPSVSRKASYLDATFGIRRSSEEIEPYSLETSEHNYLNKELDDQRNGVTSPNGVDEKTPLLNVAGETEVDDIKRTWWRLIPKNIVAAFIGTLRWVFSALAAPGFYIASHFYDEEGTFAPLLPTKTLVRILSRRASNRSTSQAIGISGSVEEIGTDPPLMVEKTRRVRPTSSSSSRSPSADSISSVLTSESETNSEKQLSNDEKRASVLVSTEEGSPARRSTRIKVRENTALIEKKNRKSASSSVGGSHLQPPITTAASLKSPTSPASHRMTKYPRAPAPPRPLVPRRLPSFTRILEDPSIPVSSKKTLILDLDETLIHSLAKGGRMSQGHMVEVKLTVAGGDGIQMPPQHPILYYVHKRPHCDEFLRKVCKWYNVVIFTASVQEYADPVIDWLEAERKYFVKRLYRQHCTYRNGNYIKDLASVEPDLSRVMIVDNSPTSYVFHEDNAIPIEGWINDPTDNDLLHLIPLLEAMAQATDVRALLGLRMGETFA